MPWSVRAADAGKHVLCEKPIAMSAAETLELIAARDRAGVVVGEAFMVRTHPQWARLIELVRGGRIGELRSGLSSFCYFNRDPKNVRNVRAWGGGALLDIGCYPIKTSRMVFGAEPKRVAATIARDPELDGIDRLTSAVLEYPSGHMVFTCCTQAAANQSALFLGTKGRIWLDIPFNPRGRTTWRACASMTAATCPAAASRSRRSRPATSTRFRATCSRAPFAKAASRRFRWKIRFATWR